MSYTEFTPFWPTYKSCIYLNTLVIIQWNTLQGDKCALLCYIFWLIKYIFLYFFYTAVLLLLLTWSTWIYYFTTEDYEIMIILMSYLSDWIKGACGISKISSLCHGYSEIRLLSTARRVDLEPCPDCTLLCVLYLWWCLSDKGFSKVRSINHYRHYCCYHCC